MAFEPYPKSRTQPQIQVWDVGDFHTDCANVIPLLGPGYLVMWCGNCRVAAHIDHVGTVGCDYEAAMAPRQKGAAA